MRALILSVFLASTPAFADFRDGRPFGIDDPEISLSGGAGCVMKPGANDSSGQVSGCAGEAVIKFSKSYQRNNCVASTNNAANVAITVNISPFEEKHLSVMTLTPVAAGAATWTWRCEH